MGQNLYPNGLQDPQWHEPMLHPGLVVSLLKMPMDWHKPLLPAFFVGKESQGGWTRRGRGEVRSPHSLRARRALVVAFALV